MKSKHFINLHKALTFPFILTLMFIYQNFQFGAWVYLALHGTYGLLWLLKDQIYPDKQWEQEISVGTGILGFVSVSLYWIAPFILISSDSQPPLPLVAAAISLNIIGSSGTLAKSKCYVRLLFLTAVALDNLATKTELRSHLSSISDRPTPQYP